MRQPTDIMTVYSHYGMRNGSFHDGTDRATPMHTELFSVADNGELKKKGISSVYGNYVDIDHGTFQVRYAHLDKFPIHPVGHIYKEGDSLGKITGNTGLSTGPHCHIETRIGSYEDIQKKDPVIPSKFLTSVDPELFFKKELPISQMLKLCVYQWEDWELFCNVCDGISSSTAIGPEELEHIIKMGANVKYLYEKLFKF